MAYSASSCGSISAMYSSNSICETGVELEVEVQDGAEKRNLFRGGQLHPVGSGDRVYLPEDENYQLRARFESYSGQFSSRNASRPADMFHSRVMQETAIDNIRWKRTQTLAIFEK